MTDHAGAVERDVFVEAAMNEVARRRGGGICAEDLPDNACYWSGEALAAILLSALSASEARLRVAVEALGRITTGPGSIAGARDIARQALATIEGEGS